MNIENLGLVKVSKRGKDRFAKLPVPLCKDAYGIPLTVIRFPSSALYARPDDATTYFKKMISLSKGRGEEGKTFLRMLYDSLREIQLESSKPLEVPIYLMTDKAGRVGCLKITEGPAILALYTPDDIIKVLKMLCLDFGKIIFHDKRDIEMRLSIERIAT